jgi:hypothetical protein
VYYVPKFHGSATLLCLLMYCIVFLDVQIGNLASGRLQLKA